MVAMNPQTWDKDVAEIEPGGYLFYDSTKPLPPSKLPRRHQRHRRAADRDLQRATTPTPRQRQLFKNIIYLGALSALLDIDVPAIEKLIGEQFKGKDTLIEPNLHALQLGRDYALAALRLPDRPALEAPSTRSATASSSTATTRRRWAASMAAPPSRLVPDHAVLLARRGLRRALPAASPRSRRPRKSATPSSRPRTSWPRSAW